MDEIAFAVAERDLPTGMQVCVEPVINGERFVRILERAEGKPTGYAGPEPQILLAALDPAAERAQVRVLRCACGDDLCSWARVDVVIEPERILWRDVRASRAEPDGYYALDPYEFSRDQYEQALAQARDDACLR